LADIERTDDRSTMIKNFSEPVRARPVTFWWAVTALTLSLLLALGGIILARDLARVFALVVVGVSIANALAPVVTWLVEHIHLPRTVAILLVYLLLVLIFVIVLWRVIPVLVAQVRALITQIESLVPQITSTLSTTGLDPAALLGSFSSITSRIGGILFALPATVFSSLLDFVLVIFVSLYWLVLMNSMRGFFLSFFPEEQKPRVHHVLSEMGGSMGGYLRGSAIDGLIFATLKYIGLLIIGVPYALTLGILAFVLEFFPTIGAIVSATVATLVGLSVSPTLALVTLIFTILLQQGENHILVPLVMRSQTSISPLLAVLAVVAGGAIGGILGAVAGIPIVSALDVLVRLVIAPAIRRANGVKIDDAPAQATEQIEKEG
jgi:putative heme transporter